MVEFGLLEFAYWGNNWGGLDWLNTDEFIVSHVLVSERIPYDGVGVSLAG